MYQFPNVNSDHTLSVTFARDLGSMKVSSSPNGATIFIDGVASGTTPTTVDNIPTGTHELRLALAGYNDYTRSGNRRERPDNKRPEDYPGPRSPRHNHGTNISTHNDGHDNDTHIGTYDDSDYNSQDYDNHTSTYGDSDRNSHNNRDGDCCTNSDYHRSHDRHHKRTGNDVQLTVYFPHPYGAYPLTNNGRPHQQSDHSAQYNGDPGYKRDPAGNTRC